MKFSNSLIKAKIIKRYKRFLADITLDKTSELHPQKAITAYICNTGSMRTCWEPSQKILLSYHDNPKRKLKYQVEMIHNEKTWIGVNTSLTNKIVIEALKNKEIDELSCYENIKPEIKLEKSRLDILLYNGHISEIEKKKDDFCYVEIKSVTLKEEGQSMASFPDAVSTRGQKHLEELIKIKKMGYRAVMFYLVQREDVDAFRPASHIDKKYADLFNKAIKAGVEILVYKCHLTQNEITIHYKLPYCLA